LEGGANAQLYGFGSNVFGFFRYGSAVDSESCRYKSRHLTRHRNLKSRLSFDLWATNLTVIHSVAKIVAELRTNVFTAIRACIVRYRQKKIRIFAGTANSLAKMELWKNPKPPSAKRS